MERYKEMLEGFSWILPVKMKLEQKYFQNARKVIE